MVEIYAPCLSRKFSRETLSGLLAGWERVFDLLQGAGMGEIGQLEGMEISLLDDAEMARVHGEFLDEATPTDVITFAHGELLIGVEVAVRQARDFGSTPDREIALYGIHGMLHLAGYDDRSAEEAQAMSERQEELLGEFFDGFGLA